MTEDRAGITDQRRRDRAATDIPGHLISDQLDVACKILDISKTGARLQIMPGLFLPKHFVLRAQELGGDRWVDVVWRNRTQLGVRFSDAPGGSRTTGSSPRRRL